MTLFLPLTIWFNDEFWDSFDSLMMFRSWWYAFLQTALILQFPYYAITWGLYFVRIEVADALSFMEPEYLDFLSKDPSAAAKLGREIGDYSDNESKSAAGIFDSPFVSTFLEKQIVGDITTWSPSMIAANYMLAWMLLPVTAIMGLIFQILAPLGLSCLIVSHWFTGPDAVVELLNSFVPLIRDVLTALVDSFVAVIDFLGVLVPAA